MRSLLSIVTHTDLSNVLPAAADLLMGVYLLVIASADEAMRGEYNSHAHAWMTSWVCTGAGVLSMISSEVIAG